MNPPQWCAPYIGLAFEDHGRGPAFDCWGIVCEIFAKERGVTLPDYVAAYASAGDRHSVAAAVEEGCKLWQKVSDPQPFDVVILRLAGRPWHCGVIVAEDWMLHALSDVGVVLEKVSSPVWRNRVEGFYRHD